MQRTNTGKGDTKTKRESEHNNQKNKKDRKNKATRKIEGKTGQQRQIENERQTGQKKTRNTEKDTQKTGTTKNKKETARTKSHEWGQKAGRPGEQTQQYDMDLKSPKNSQTTKT